MIRPALRAALIGVMATAAQSETVEIPGPEGPLQGELLLPQGAQAGVVIVPGSGPIDRDGRFSTGRGALTYRLLAEALAAEGVASLRIDKRGLFGSKAAISDPEAVTVEAYGEDVSHWAALLSARLGKECVWLAGHSEGGLVSLAVASAGAPGVCGLVLLAAPGRRLSVILREQLARQPQTKPFEEEMERILSTLERGERVDIDSLSPALRQPWRDSIQGFLINLFAKDPVALARAYPGPVLVIQGERDAQITRVDATALAGAAPGAELRLFPQMTHMLKDDVEGAPYATYEDPDLPLTRGLAEAIAAFTR
ncbi:alpha/beta hydrolase [Oceanicola sp. D3]|uniref:alpha/beta hydrolase n=1 Tax=Oceanicola sp. D3 TaxID=2587163 RepID=UPI001122170F|nr:alpha/beta fold hydrolase [Oceanicola sp. D3]QDC09835.1 alpha/beta hydrolase [Oceanicola sp. D3]